MASTDESRSRPPNVAAKLATNAPTNNDTTSHNASSRSRLARVVSDLFRLGGGLIEILLQPRKGIGHALFRFRRGKPGFRRHELAQVLPVRLRKLTGLERIRDDARDLRNAIRFRGLRSIWRRAAPELAGAALLGLCGTANPRSSRADSWRLLSVGCRGVAAPAPAIVMADFATSPPALTPGRNSRADRRRQQRRHEQCRHRPGQEPMRRVAKEDFIGVHGDPARAQPPRQVSAQHRRQQLHDGDPDDGGDAGRGARDALAGPRRHDREAEARAEQEQHERQRRRADGAGDHGAPGNRASSVVWLSWDCEGARLEDEMQERLTLACRSRGTSLLEMPSSGGEGVHIYDQGPLRNASMRASSASSACRNAGVFGARPLT